MIKPLVNRRGFTLLEVLTASTVMALLLVCTVSMLMAALQSVDADLAQVNTDTNAVTSMQWMITWVREAQKFQILDAGPTSGRRLCITLPVTTSKGYYDKTQSDTANPMYFYLSDSTGVVGHTGTWLWRSWKGNLVPIRRDVDALLFESDTDMGADAVQITITTKDSVYKGTRQTDLTQRVIYMRNYYNH